MLKPSVGRIVHYVSRGDPNCSAPHANGPHRYCACGWVEATYGAGTWHWPERVEEDQ